jgi:hypothetical protein
MKPWLELGDKASGPACVDQVFFVASTLCELSVGLRRGNALMYLASLGMLAKSSGTELQAGMQPTDEYDG